MKSLQEQDPNRRLDWTARFVTADGHLIEKVEYQNCTQAEAGAFAKERQAVHGNRCDDYSITESPKGAKR